MYCRNCGKQIADGAKFCPYCGTKQTVPVQAQPAPPRAAQPKAQPAAAPQPAPVPQPAPAAAPKPKKRKRWPIVLVVVLLLAALAAVGYLVVWPWWQKKAATAGDESNNSSAAAVSESTAEAAAEATPEPTATPPASALTDAEKTQMLSDLQSAQNAIQQHDNDTDVQNAVSQLKAISETASAKYPEATGFAPMSPGDTVDLGYDSGEYVYTVANDDGTEKDDELCLSGIVVYEDGSICEIQLFQYGEDCMTVDDYYNGVYYDGWWQAFHGESDYDETGKIVKEGSKEGPNLGDEWIRPTTYSYDASGNLQTMSVGDGEGYTYKYDTNANLIEENYDGDFLKKVYTYDANNLLTSLVTYSNGQQLSGETYEYEYDSSGNVVKKICKVQATGEIKETYTYDGAGHKLEWVAGTGDVVDEYTWINGRLDTMAGDQKVCYYYAPKELLVALGKQNNVTASLNG